MYLIEAQRGCRFRCRFCLVSCAFKPARFRSLENILPQAQEGLKWRRRLGLVGPSVTDHPQIEELVTRLRGMGAEISVSSLRIKPLPPMVLGEVVKGGTRTVALAPEAGSQRLRTYIRKGINEDNILKAVGMLAAQGVKQLKLYFMVGLPTETDGDIEEMARLVKRCRVVLDKGTAAGRITLTIAPFVPKAGTAFERKGMAAMTVVRQRITLLKRLLAGAGIGIKHDSIEWSDVQAVLSRGDARLASVIAGMNEVTLAEWERGVEKVGLDTDFYAHATWGPGQELPWVTPLLSPTN